MCLCVRERDWDLKRKKWVVSGGWCNQKLSISVSAYNKPCTLHHTCWTAFPMCENGNKNPCFMGVILFGFGRCFHENFGQNIKTRKRVPKKKILKRKWNEWQWDLSHRTRSPLFLFFFFFCFFWCLPQILTPFALFCFIFLCSHSWVCVALHVTNVFFYRTTWLTLESLVRIVRIVWNPVIWWN